MEKYPRSRAVPKNETNNNLKILVVDDSPDDCLWLQTLLEDGIDGTPVDLDFVSSSTEAKALARNYKYDFAILDYRLGAETGIDVLSELSGLEHKFQSLMLTGCPSPSLIKQAYVYGAIGCFSKAEMDRDSLQKIIMIALGKDKLAKKYERDRKRKLAKKALQIPKSPALLLNKLNALCAKAIN